METKISLALVFFLFYFLNLKFPFYLNNFFHTQKPKGYKLAFNYLKDKRYTDAIDISHYVSSLNFFFIFFSAN